MGGSGGEEKGNFGAFVKIFALKKSEKFLQLVFISSLRFSEEMLLINSLKLYHLGVKSTVAAAEVAANTQEEK